MKLKRTRFTTPQLGALCLIALLPLAAAQSATEQLSQIPLYTVSSVPPNIFFLNDDANSMDEETLINDTINLGRLAKEDAGLPSNYYTNVDGINPLDPHVHQLLNCSFTPIEPPTGSKLPYIFPDAYAFILDTTGVNTTGVNTCNQTAEKTATAIPDVAAEEEWRVRFSELNPLYYNPDIDYSPWPGGNPGNGNQPFVDMSLEAARIDPVEASQGSIDLTNDSAVLVNGKRNYYSSSDWNSWCAQYAPRTTCSGWRYYYRDKATNKIKLQWVKDLSSAIPAGKRISPRQNFANWFTYHRSRKNIGKYAIGTVVNGNATGKRLGYGTTNGVLNKGPNQTSFITDNNGAAVLNKLYNTVPASTLSSSGDTPLREALDWAGRYYQIGEPGDAGNSPILSKERGGACQLNSTILMTGGFYDSRGWPSKTKSPGNADGDHDTAFDGPPYGDSYKDTLADVAMKYYETDLAPNNTLYPNQVKVRPGIDNATHQHMNTYTISYGLEGNIKNTATVDINTITWPDPQIYSLNAGESSLLARIDDLFHAAVNGRGQYFNASTPEKLNDALNKIIGSIPSANNSSNSVATSSFRNDTNQIAIKTGFDSTHWSGTVQALKVNADGSLNERAPLWNSDTTLPFGASRTIITYDGASGIPFEWSNLQTAGLDTLLGSSSAVAQLNLNYLRGQQVSDPANTVKFRDRAVVLGDIVNSSPVYVGAPVMLYPDRDPFGTTGNRYRDFWQRKSNRTAAVYVGANDGMLHGFNAADGSELLAYVPHATFANLQLITDPSFDTAHQYFVDQTPTVADAFFRTPLTSSADWRTVLVDGLGAGGRAIFAIDITDPASFSEANASNIALWEFSNLNDSDLGYTLSKPVIAMTESNRWVVISGNGYGSDNGNAALFILYLDADPKDGWSVGGEYIKIAAGSGPNNGLFSPAAVDSDGNGKVDRVYAGDLKGNLWVFDLSDKSNPGNWKLANGGDPLFTATDSSGKAQPITSKPTVILHPTQPTTATDKPNMLVLFGTGRYLTQGDLSNSDAQSYYAVWDDGHASNLTRSDLAAQTLTTGQDNTLNIGARLTGNIDVKYGATDGKQYGWYIDLYSGAGAVPSERIITSAKVFMGYLFFTSYIPSPDPCTSGGGSWFWSLKADNGAPPDHAILSINNNRIIEADKDLVTLNGTRSAPSAIQIGGAFGLSLTADSIIIQTTNPGGGTLDIAHNLGGAASLGKRISWRELRRE